MSELSPSSGMSSMKICEDDSPTQEGAKKSKSSKSSSSSSSKSRSSSATDTKSTTTSSSSSSSKSSSSTYTPVQPDFVSDFSPYMRRCWDWVPLPTEEYISRYSQARIDKYMNKAKLEHRTSLKLEDWQRYNYAARFPAYRRQVIRDIVHVQQHHDRPHSFVGRRPLAAGLNRISVNEYTPERFIELYEAPKVPVAITNVADKWRAHQRWSPHALNIGEYRNAYLKCGEDDDGYSIKVRVKYFLQYMHTQKDDSPLYIFDSNYDNNDLACGIVDDYDKPLYFCDDLFSLVGEKRRPPYRWFLIGPERSGTSLHIDPLSTSAWNTLLSGIKQWVLFKPGCKVRDVKGTDLRRSGEDSEAITWFMNVLPRIREREEKYERETGKKSELGMIEYLQFPGETMFVPGGWWHAVVNLTDTVAVTQNFASVTNFPAVWQKARKGRKHMATRWRAVLRQKYPDLAAAAEAADKRDGYEIVFSEKSIRKKKESVARKAKNRERRQQRRRERERRLRRAATAAEGGVAAAKATYVKNAAERRGEGGESDGSVSSDSSSSTSSTSTSSSSSSSGSTSSSSGSSSD